MNCSDKALRKGASLWNASPGGGCGADVYRRGPLAGLRYGAKGDGVLGAHAFFRLAENDGVHKPYVDLSGQSELGQQIPIILDRYPWTGTNLHRKKYTTTAFRNFYACRFC